MKPPMLSIMPTAATLALASVLLAGPGAVWSAEDEPVVNESSNVNVDQIIKPDVPKKKRAAKSNILLKRIESSSADEAPARKNLPWLGISIEEASEALVSQLGLDRGVGLVITYITPDSPAAKAGLQKNDVLVTFENQSLVLPAQLRKLIQARKEGDSVKLDFFRAGKKDTATVVLAKVSADAGFQENELALKEDLRDLQRQLRDLPLKDIFRDQIKTFHESLGHVQIDQKKVQEEVRHSLEQARKAFQEAMRQSADAIEQLGPARKAFEKLLKSKIIDDTDATVTVRSTGKSTKSVVTADGSGTIVIVSNPKPHLTAHDKSGELLFDGEIDTPEQRDKVPRDLWNKVEPMLDKMGHDAEEPEPKS